MSIRHYNDYWNSISAELLRLRSVIPAIFKLKPSSPVDKIIRDFSYFDNSEYYDQEISTSTVSGNYIAILLVYNLQSLKT